MHKSIAALTTALVLTLAGEGSAQEYCERYLGQSVRPASFETVVADLSKLRPKDEFETTAQYQTRRAAALRGNTGAIVISKEPEDRKFFEYDADAGVLRIKSYAFDNTVLHAWHAFYSAGLDEKITASTHNTNIDVVVSTTDTRQGSHVASNAFGARAEVVKFRRVTKAIFDVASWIGRESLFPAADQAPHDVGVLRLSPAEAKRLKPGLKTAFVVVPKEPYFVAGRRVSEATFTDPEEITEEFSILIADIRCGLLMNGTGKVLGAYPTR